MTPTGPAPPASTDESDVLEALAKRLGAEGNALSQEDQSLLDRVQELVQQTRDLSLSVRRQRHEYTTILETVKEISLKSLDIPRFEQYTLNTIRGQFGVLKVIFLRQADYMDPNLAIHTPRLLNPPDIKLELTDPFCQHVAESSQPVDLVGDDLPEALAGNPDAEALAELGYMLALPLVKKDEQGTLALRGVMALGPRIGNRPYSQQDREFLSLLGSMIGISLHNAHLYHRSIIDFLTQVFSRGHFDIHIEQEVQRVRRYNQTVEAQGEGTPTGVTLVMLDIDHFKTFNDRYGHQIGDQVLQAVATSLKTTVRGMDIVCRYGGEEFAVILPDAASAMAVPIAERIRSAVESNRVPTDEFGPLQVTVSVGVATYPDDAVDARTLIARADAALYEAKEGGRNRVVRAHAGLPNADTA